MVRGHVLEGAEPGTEDRFAGILKKKNVWAQSVDDIQRCHQA